MLGKPETFKRGPSKYRDWTFILKSYLGAIGSRFPELLEKCLPWCDAEHNDDPTCSRTRSNDCLCDARQDCEFFLGRWSCNLVLVGVHDVAESDERELHGMWIS